MIKDKERQVTHPVQHLCYAELLVGTSIQMVSEREERFGHRLRSQNRFLEFCGGVLISDDLKHLLYDLMEVVGAITDDLTRLRRPES